MAGPETETAIDSHVLIQQTLKQANTVGDAERLLRQKAEQMEAQEVIEQGREESRAEVGATLRERAGDIAKQGKGFEAVRVEDFSGGIQGMNSVGGSKSDASVGRHMLVEGGEELHRTLVHEADSEVGHSSQAQPVVANQEAALIVDAHNKPLTRIGVLEGDVEQGEGSKTGRGATSKRKGQPIKDYGEGQDGANTAIRLVGKDVWDKHLKETGQYGELQKAIWIKRLQQGEKIKTVLEEAQKTGYEEEAYEAVLARAA